MTTDYDLFTLNVLKSLHASGQCATLPAAGCILHTPAQTISVDRDGGVRAGEAGRADDGQTLHCSCSYQTLVQLLGGSMTLGHAVRAGLLVFRGPPETYFHLMRLFWHGRALASMAPAIPAGRPPAHADLAGASDMYCKGIYTIIAAIGMTRDELDRQIDQRLDRLVHAIAGSGEFRRAMGAEQVQQGQPWTRARLARLPVLHKPLLTDINVELGLMQLPGLVRLNTSGTTGKKFILYRTQLDYWMGFFRYLVLLERFGYAAIPRTYFPNPGLKVCELFRTSQLIVMADAAQSGADHVSNIEGAQVEVLYSFPLFLQKILTELESKHKRLAHVTHIVTVGDFLDACTRRRCRQVFPHARITSTYGSTETGLMAYQCEHGADYHVIEPDFTVRVWRDGAIHQSGLGRLLVTKLCDGGTPLLNYDVGDEVLLHDGPCACGETRASFRYLGRSTHQLSLVGGVLNAATVDAALAPLDVVKEYVASWNEASQVLEVAVVAEMRVAGLDQKIAGHLGLRPDQVLISAVACLPPAHAAKRANFSIVSAAVAPPVPTPPSRSSTNG